MKEKLLVLIIWAWRGAFVCVFVMGTIACFQIHKNGTEAIAIGTAVMMVQILMLTIALKVRYRMIPYKIPISGWILGIVTTSLLIRPERMILFALVMTAGSCVDLIETLLVQPMRLYFSQPRHYS